MAAAKAWQRMCSGRWLDILAPSPVDIEIEDIALGLSRLARWNGQTIGEHAYTVAQHSILVAELVATDNPGASAKQLLAALLHDAPEFLVADLVTPVKRAVGDTYRDLEHRVAEAVHSAFGLPATLPVRWKEVISAADAMAACIEAVELAGFSEAEARQVTGVRRPIPKADLIAWDGPTARRAFLTVYADLATGGEQCIGKWSAPRTGVDGKPKLKVV